MKRPRRIERIFQMAAYMITFDGVPYTMNDLKTVGEFPNAPMSLLFLDIYEDSEEVVYFTREDAEDICDYLSNVIWRGSPCAELIGLKVDVPKHVEYVANRLKLQKSKKDR